MRVITSKNITTEQIAEVNRELGYDDDSQVLSKHGYAFYYRQLSRGVDRCDADRYANLNTILGYDVGIRKFYSLDHWLWEHGFDLMELSGTDNDKALLQETTNRTRTKPLDFSKWRDLSSERYSYLYFEGGIGYE